MAALIQKLTMIYNKGVMLIRTAAAKRKKNPYDMNHSIFHGYSLHCKKPCYPFCFSLFHFVKLQLLFFPSTSVCERMMILLVLFVYPEGTSLKKKQETQRKTEWNMCSYAPPPSVSPPMSAHSDTNTVFVAPPLGGEIRL